MKYFLKNAFLFCALVNLIALSTPLHAQDDEDTQGKPYHDSIQKGFNMGLYIGAYFPNKFTASLYDGYGYDINGQRNDFANSILRNEIVNYYGGGNGGVDQIAQLLNVNHTDWYFNQGGMPFNLRYTTATMVGLNTRYRLNKKQSISLNINGTKLTVNGKFNVNTTATGTSTTGVSGPSATQHQFTIVGAEQRLVFQFGYQRYFGKNERIQFLVEGGMNIIMSKLQKHQAYLVNGSNSIVIDLTNIYNLPQYNYYSKKYFVGVGIGAYAGLGLNININPKYTIQLVYNPSYDRIPLGDNPVFKLQHGVGLRFYYNFR